MGYPLDLPSPYLPPRGEGVYHTEHLAPSPMGEGARSRGRLPTRGEGVLPLDDPTPTSTEPRTHTTNKGVVGVLPPEPPTRRGEPPDSYHPLPTPYRSEPYAPLSRGGVSHPRCLSYFPPLPSSCPPYYHEGIDLVLAEQGGGGGSHHDQALFDRSSRCLLLVASR